MFSTMKVLQKVLTPLRNSKAASYPKPASSKGGFRSFCRDERPLGRRTTSGGLSRMASIEFVPTVADDPVDLADSLSEMQGNATRERVPWFQAAMPPAYFRQVPKERRLQHLVSVAAVPDLEDVPEMVSREYHDNGELGTVSIISSGRETMGRLESALDKVPNDAIIEGVHSYTSNDNLVTVTDFSLNFAESLQETIIPKDLQEYLTKLQSGSFETDRQQYLKNTGEKLHAAPSDNFTEENILSFMKNIVHSAMWNVSPRRFCKFVELYHTLLKQGTDQVLLDVESNYGGTKGKYMYTLALSNIIVKPTMGRISRYFESKGMIIERCHVDRVHQSRVQEDAEFPEYNDVAFLRLLVSENGTSIDKHVLDELKQSLPLVAKWYDDAVMDNFYEFKSKSELSKGRHLTPVDFEILCGLLDCVHLINSGTQMYEFSKPNMYQVLDRPQAYDIAELFQKKFDKTHTHPEQEPQGFKAAADKIRDSFNQYVEVPVEKKVLAKMLDIVEAAERTNLYNPERFALSIKLNPEVCMDPLDKLRTETPYGIFYVNGRRFRGMQLRFREISRGGLRLVTPNSPQSLTIESTRQFGECYDLGFAQQQKNKDIAEGGSKAVCLIDVVNDAEGLDRKHVLRRSVKAFVNSLLDLITVDENNSQEELIFLGPDEQIIVEHINWIVRRAQERGYRMPTAFMSSKPDQGFNHKEFGVTSEGVAVFLDEGLKTLGIINQPTFTVKITGGPDGDVAGNMLKILHREYGDQCKVVGIADGTGCVEDQVNGIDWGELLRLVDASLPLDQIDKSKLNSSTEVHTLEKAEGVHMRNTMHNRLKADAFIPGGGRPATINETNWEQFLQDGVPSSKLIVEGANLFLTNYAREQLGKKGVVIVKDSSANKCGVICSSFEIISCMLLEKAKFLEIKSDLVPQVLDKLRLIARREAELLMTEYRKNSTRDGKMADDFNLVSTSIEISSAINRATDLIRSKLEQLVQEDQTVLEQFKPLVKEFLPDTLVEAGWNEFDEKVPAVYVTNLVSTILACELVYNEGVDFTTAIKEDSVLTDTVFTYINEKRKVLDLIEKLGAGKSITEDDKMVVGSLLRLGGPRTALMAGGISNLYPNNS